MSKIQSGNFEIVRASAGSGKTFRLVLRYLECALRYDNPKYFSRILALTFTNKAAGEMKSRILSDLKDLVDGKSDKIEDLSSSLNLSESQLVSRATVLHKEMLHRYSDIAVMTIDSFVNRLVRSFARDLSIEQDYRIEIDSNRVIEDAVSQLLDKVGTKGNESLTKLLEGFALQKVAEDEESGVRSPLNRLGKAVIQEKMKHVISMLSEIAPEDFTSISKSLRDETSHSEKQLRDVVVKASLQFSALCIDEDDLPKRGGVIPILNNLRKGFPVPPTKTFLKYAENYDAMVLSGASAESKEKAQSLGPIMMDVLDTVHKMQSDTEEGRKYQLAKKLNKRIALMGTLAALHQEIEQVQVDNNIRTFHAMHEKISDIVKRNPAPFIYERLGNRFNHIFMDEFQDTSVTQWHNLVVLYHHALSNNHKTLVVGDGKQAVYRFRNGDYKQLLDLPNLQSDAQGQALKDAERAFNQNKYHNNLDDNWRSGSKIVEWNNDLFTEISTRIPDHLEKVYEGLKQNPRQHFTGGVHLNVVEGKSSEDRREAHTQAIIDRINAYTDEGFNLGDITILVRENKIGARLAQELLKVNIKPMTEESLHLGRHPGPLAVIALIKWLIRPSDIRQSTTLLQCVASLKTDLEPISEAELLTKFVVVKGVKMEINMKEMLLHLFPNFQPIKRSTGPLVGFVGHICDELGLTEYYPSYAEGLMELAREVSGTEESGLHGFIRIWDSAGYKKSVVTSKSSDSVQIMTIHKAKGLDFKIAMVLMSHKSFTSFKGVIPVEFDKSAEMPVAAAMLEDGDMKDTLVEDQRQLELNRVLLDEINVAYVAFTRPVERLDVVLELDKINFDRANVSTIPQLIISSLESISESDVGNGYQTVDVSSVQPFEDVIDNIQYPLNLKTGANVNQLVSKVPSGGLSAKPEELSSTELGSEVHRLLEKVIEIKDWELVKKTASAGLSIGKEDLKEVFNRVDKVLLNTLTSQYFKPGLHVECEKSFVDGNGSVVRPDRIIRDGTKWTVIDYKSTKSGEKAHRSQLENYVKMLSEIEDGDVEGVLIYTSPLEVIKIP
jgi:ATP-dependent exoDNAse (exonuclease V) beta subunit